MLKSLLLGCAALIAVSTQVVAQARVSECMAVANRLDAGFHLAALTEDQARLTYVGHSTFIVESPGGVKIATDYAGHAGGLIPDVATMNHAHSSHYTDTPDPSIKHVLRGWGEAGSPARHDLDVGDVRIRNVPTDIRGGSLGRVKDGNSIFIFEVAGLCIGHLGHLHHELSDDYMGWIGRLDIVLVPVDGSFTLDVAGMIEVLKALKAPLMIPMHYFSSFTLERFMHDARQVFEVETSEVPTVVVSRTSLPKTPKILVLPGN